MKEALLTKYLATVIHGDSDVSAGTTVYIKEKDVQEAIEHGLRFYIQDMGGDGGQKWYPCEVQKLQYELKSTEDCGKSSFGNIKASYYHHEYDWQEHWC